MTRSEEVRACGALEAFAAAVGAARDALGWSGFGGDMNPEVGDGMAAELSELMALALELEGRALEIARPLAP